MNKTVLAKKIGETVLCDENGSLIYLNRHKGYSLGLYGYWLLSGWEGNWRIVKFLMY